MRSQLPVQMVLPVLFDLAEVDNIIERAVSAGNPLIATEEINRTSKIMTVKGVKLAKLFWGLRDNWPLFRAAGISEDFSDFIDAHTFAKSRTANRYADMYDAIFVKGGIPNNILEQFYGKPIETLLLMAPAVRDGSLTDEDLADAVILNHKGVRDLIRERRGHLTNSTAHVYGILVQRESTLYPMGTLIARKEGESEAIASFNLSPRTDAGRKLLDRVKNLLQLEDIR